MKYLGLFLSFLIGNVLGTAKVCKDVAPGNRPRTDRCPYQIQVDQVMAQVFGFLQ